MGTSGARPPGEVLLAGLGAGEASPATAIARCLGADVVRASVWTPGADGLPVILTGVSGIAGAAGDGL